VLIAKGQRVLAVPHSACVGTVGLRCGAGGTETSPLPHGATTAERLAWTLLSLRGNRAWAPYLAALPHVVDSPMAGAWDHGEIAELQVGDAVAAAAISLAKDAKMARTIAAALEAENGAGAPPRTGAGGGGSGGEVLGVAAGTDAGKTNAGEADAVEAHVARTTESESEARDAMAKDWAWALSCVRSRAIELEGRDGSAARQSLLVPFVDMINHVHDDPHVAWSSHASADGGGVVTCEIDQGGEGGESGCPSLDDTGCQPGASHSISSGGGCVELTAERDIAAGEEITITYAADAPSDAFALYMGFLGGHNARDSVQIFVSLRAAAAWYAATFKGVSGEAVVDAGRAQGLADAFTERAETDEAAPRVGWGGGVSGPLMDLFEHLNMQIMPERDAGELATHAVKLRCEEMLLGLRTTAEDDMALLETGRGSDRLKLAVEFRLRKKAILTHMLSMS